MACLLFGFSVDGSLLEAGGMYATENDLVRLQEVLDRSVARANLRLTSMWAYALHPEQLPA
jgi:hypothetical protein